MATERMYLVKTVSGEEMGPADQETLVKWAEGGKIHPDDQIRSTMIAKWDKAISLDFLKPLLLEQQESEVLKHKNTWWAKLWAQMNLRAPELLGGSGIVNPKLETYPSASFVMRLMAIIFDVLINFFVAIGIYFICVFLFRGGTIDQNNAAYVCMTMIFLFVLLYYVLQISLRTQTVGQRFWGIFLIRRDGQKFWMGRVFFYTVFMMVFGVLTPLFMICGLRSIPEMLTGMRMVKVKLVKNRM